MSRFFFAICPDKSTTKTIVKCRDQLNLSGRMIKESNLHLTLLFLGRLNVNQLQKIIRQTEQIRCTEFDMVLNYVGYFKKADIAWLGLEFVPDLLLDLHTQLLSAADICAIPLQAQRYKPHVSLARRSAPVEKQLINPIKWHAENFVLVESIDTARGAHYKPVQYFSC